jgi:hypothetical protein
MSVVSSSRERIQPGIDGSIREVLGVESVGELTLKAGERLPLGRLTLSRDFVGGCRRERLLTLDTGSESSRMRSMVDEAKSLVGSGEERVREILGIVWRNMEYPSSESLRRLDEPSRDWVVRKVIDPLSGKPGSRDYRVSEAVELGFGDCMAQTAAFIVCAREAGLKAAIAYGTVRNTETEGLGLRGERGRLFLFYPPGQNVGHVWAYADIDRELVHVDAVTGLIGTKGRPQHMRVFRENYFEEVRPPLPLWESGLPPELEFDIRPMGRYVGEPLVYDVSLGIQEVLGFKEGLEGSSDVPVCQEFRGRVSFWLDDLRGEPDEGTTGRLRISKFKPHLGFSAKRHGIISP